MSIQPATAHDSGIRRELLRVLKVEFASDPSTLLLDEFGILEGRTRIDVAAINGALHGFEIKSERDTLSRLRSQSEAYGRVFDFVTIVATQKHAPGATKVVPAWWGLAVAEPTRHGVRIRQEREPRRNPLVESEALIQLLWRSEVVSILTDLGMGRGTSGKSRRVLWQRLTDALASREVVGHVVRETIKARRDWRCWI